MSGTSKIAAVVVRSLLFGALVSGCVYKPKITERFDEECQVYSKRMTLEAAGLLGIEHCDNADQCLIALTVLGVVSTATAVVSGSIVVVGNTVYWLERLRTCSDPLAKE